MEFFNEIKHLPRKAVLILLIGLLLRIVVVVFHQRPLVSDERDYHQLAVNLLATGTYGVNDIPTAYRPFAYPAIISAVYAIAGEYPLIVKLFQAFLDCYTALFLFLLLKEKGRRVQLIALSLWSVYLPAVLYTNFLLSETIFTFLLVGTVLFLERTKLEHAFQTLTAGFLLGILTLMKPAMLLFITVLSIVMAIVSIPLRQYKFVVVGTLLVLLPWLYRNYHSLGKPTIATNGGINLLIGNNPNATGAYVVNFSEDILKNAQNEVEADELGYRYAWNYIAGNPSRFLLNGIKKIAHLFSSEGGLLVWSFHDHPDDGTERYAIKYSSLSFPMILLVNLPYVCLLLLGIVGVFSAERDTLWWLFMGIVACWLFTHFVFFGGSRFHFPIMPFCASFAAQVITNVPSAIKRLTFLQRISFSIILVGLVSVWVAETYAVLHALPSN